MAQNYEVFVGDKPLLICSEIVDNSAFEGYLHLEYDGGKGWPILLENMSEQADCKGAVIVTDSPKMAWKAFKKNFKRINAAGGFVLDEKKRLLTIRRLGLWDLPKGKIEKGEDRAICALREVEEECGVKDLTLGKHIYTTWHTYSFKGKEVLKRTDWFAMSTHSNQELKPQLEEDIERVKWMDLAGINELLEDTYASIERVVNTGFNRPRI